jgi:hypothetical protein
MAEAEREDAGAPDARPGMRDEDRHRPNYAKYALPGGALALGLLLGAWLFSGPDPVRVADERVAEARAEIDAELAAARGEAAQGLDALRAEGREGFETLRAEAQQGLDALRARAEELGREVERLDPIEQGQQALRQTADEAGRRFDELETRLGDALDMGESGQRAREEAEQRVAALERRLQTMADQMARMIQRMQGGMASGGAGTETGDRAARGGTGAAAPATERSGDSALARAAASPEGERMTLRFGQLTRVGGRQLFISRVDPDAGEVGVLVIGGEASDLAEGDSVSVGNCEMRVVRVGQGEAEFMRRCDGDRASAGEAGSASGGAGSAPASPGGGMQGERELALRFGQVVRVDGRDLFVARMEGGDGALELVEARGGAHPLSRGETASIGRCDMRLEDVADRRARFALSCGGEREADARAVDRATSPGGARSGPRELALRFGQVVRLGGRDVFVSRLDGESGAIELTEARGGAHELARGEAAEIAECAVRLEEVTRRAATVTLSCGG